MNSNESIKKKDLRDTRARITRDLSFVYAFCEMSDTLSELIPAHPRQGKTLVPGSDFIAGIFGGMFKLLMRDRVS